MTTEVTHFYYDNVREPECADICASNANCIAASYFEGNCYIYDSTAEMAPEGALDYVAGASEIVSMLSLVDKLGAITLCPEFLSADESFMDTWLESTDSYPLGPTDSYTYFTVYLAPDEDGSYLSACRQWCAHSGHCVGFFLVHTTGRCYIYDLKVTSKPLYGDLYSSRDRSVGGWKSSTWDPGTWVAYGIDKSAVPASVMIYIHIQTYINPSLIRNLVILTKPHDMYFAC